MSTPKKYAICATPRSGTSLFCRGMQDTQLAGMPSEFFNPSVMYKVRERAPRTADVPEEAFSEIEHGWKRRPSPEALQVFIRFLLEHFSTENGSFGVKVFYRHYERVLCERPIHELLPGCCYIRITRRDRVRQAISYYRLLHSNRAGSGEHPPLHYSFRQIFQYHVQFIENDENWNHYFRAHNIEPLAITYEDFVESYERTIRSALAFTGVTLGDDFAVAKPTTRQASDELTEQWVERYLTDLGRYGLKAESFPRVREVGSPANCRDAA